MDKYVFPIADCVIFENYCNLSCDYCFLRENLQSQIPKELLSGYYENLLRCIGFAKANNIAMFKLSGGEIFLHDKLFNAVMKETGFQKIQILTNGTLIRDEHIQRISQRTEVGLQLSLDGHTFEMNFSRFKSRGLFQRVKDLLEYIVKKDIPVEVNMCLTRENVESLKLYIEYLMTLRGRVILNIIPVREEKEHLAVKEEQLIHIEEIILKYDAYESVLPPKEYLKLMLFVLKSKNKPEGWKCYINKAVLSIQGDGDIKICPEVPTIDNTVAANAFSYGDNSKQYNPIDEIIDSKRAELLSNYSGRIPICKGCFTHYEIINLYVKGMISEEQLRRIWIYDNDVIVHRLNEIRRCGGEQL